MTSVCDPRGPVPAAQPSANRPAVQSKILRFQEGVGWEGVGRQDYKQYEAVGTWRGVSRWPLVGPPAQSTVPFHFRYFEVEPGGYTSLEKHAHEHILAVTRGQGTVTLGDRIEPVSVGDIIYVAPWEVHQLANPTGPEPFGFFCVVPAERDRPIKVERPASQGAPCFSIVAD